MQNHQNIFIVSDLRKHFQLLQLDIERVVVVDKENFQLFRKQKGAFLEDEVDCFEDEIADLILAGDHGDKRSTYFVVVGSDCFGTRKVIHIPNYQTNR